MTNEYKYVPVDPTEEMVKTASDTYCVIGHYPDLGLLKDAISDAIPAAPAQPSPEQENESEILLDWLIRQVSGKEFRRIGIEYSAGCTIDDLKQAMKNFKKPDITEPSTDEPKFNALFEVESKGIVGTTEAKIKRVNHEDDGSYTVVIDHWPTEPLDNPDKVTREAIRNAALEEVLEWLETEVTAIDTWYRGDPSYEYDAGYMKDRVMNLLNQAKVAFKEEHPAPAESDKETVRNAALEEAALKAESLFNTPGRPIAEHIRRLKSLPHIPMPLEYIVGDSKE